jgi:uncharacterized protein (DUF2267 family)
LSQTQQEFLKNAMGELRLNRKDFAQRIGAPWDTFRRWLMASDADGTREMPPVAWSLIREVLEHERLKIEHGKLKSKILKN